MPQFQKSTLCIRSRCLPIPSEFGQRMGVPYVSRLAHGPQLSIYTLLLAGWEAISLEHLQHFEVECFVQLPLRPPKFFEVFAGRRPEKFVPLGLDLQLSRSDSTSVRG